MSENKSSASHHGLSPSTFIKALSNSTTHSYIRKHICLVVPEQYAMPHSQLCILSNPTIHHIVGFVRATLRIVTRCHQVLTHFS